MDETYVNNRMDIKVIFIEIDLCMHCMPNQCGYLAQPEG